MASAVLGKLDYDLFPSSTRSLQPTPFTAAWLILVSLDRMRLPKFRFAVLCGAAFGVAIPLVVMAL